MSYCGVMRTDASQVAKKKIQRNFIIDPSRQVIGAYSRKWCIVMQDHDSSHPALMTSTYVSLGPLGLKLVLGKETWAVKCVMELAFATRCWQTEFRQYFLSLIPFGDLILHWLSKLRISCRCCGLVLCMVAKLWHWELSILQCLVLDAP